MCDEEDDDSSLSGLSARTLGVLGEAGWLENTKRTWNVVRHELEESGFEVKGKVRAFLDRFYGLVLFPRGPASKLTIRIDPIKGLEWIDREFVVHCSETVGKKLCPVGVYSDVETILVSEDGAIFTEDGEFIKPWGMTIGEGVENLCSQRVFGDPIEIPPTAEKTVAEEVELQSRLASIPVIDPPG